MALTASKLIYYGPFDVAFKTDAASTLSLAGLKPDSLVLNVETKKGNVVFEDGTEEDWEEGRKLVGTLTVSEFNTTDQASIEGCNNLVITMDNGKTITIGTTCRFFCDVQAGKTVISIFKTTALGNEISNLVAIS